MAHFLIALAGTLVYFICKGIYSACCSIKEAVDASLRTKELKDAVAKSPSFQHKLDNDPALKEWYNKHPDGGIATIIVIGNEIWLSEYGIYRKYKICETEEEMEEERKHPTSR